MFKNIKIQIGLLMLLLLNWSCVNDEGNYNYNEINEVNVTGLAAEYTAYFRETLKITPNVSFTKDENTNSDRYSYQWVVANPAKTAEGKKVLATTKDLNVVLELPPAKYDVYYSIKDLETGVTWTQKSFVLNVVSNIYEGWLVIGDVDGKARLDMVSLIPGVTQPLILNDVLAVAGSALKLSGKAVDVATFFNPVISEPMYGIYVTASESGTSRIEENTFQWNQTQNIAYETTIAGDFPTNFAVDFMKSPNGGENIIYKNGNIYYFNRTQGFRYGLPANKIDAEIKPFYAAPFIAEGFSSFGNVRLVFDRDARRFLSYNPTAGNCTILGTGALLDWNNTNSDLIYMTTSFFNNNEIFAVLKNRTTNKYNLLRCTKAAVQTYYKEILNAPDFDKATKFAVSPGSGYLFYVVGGKLYEYDNGTQKAKLMLDKGAEEITYIGFHPNAKTSSVTNPQIFSDKIVVGSYGTTGKLEVFTVPPVNGDLVLNNTYSGLCKIVDVAFRSR